MHLTHQRTSRILLTLLAVPAATVVAACGSSSSSPASSGGANPAASAGGSAQFAKYQSCLKSHGVTLPNRGTLKRPSGSGSTGQFTPPGGEAGAPPSGGFKGGRPGGFGATASKHDQAALKACAKDAPAGAGGFGAGDRPGGAGGGAGAQFSAATLKSFAACTKQHGYTLPKANTSGTGPVYPRSIETNPKFQTASKSCQSLLRPSGGPAPAGAGG